MQTFQHQGIQHLVLPTGTQPPPGYQHAGPLQLGSDDVEVYLSSIERPHAAPVLHPQPQVASPGGNNMQATHTAVPVSAQHSTQQQPTFTGKQEIANFYKGVHMFINYDPGIDRLGGNRLLFFELHGAMGRGLDIPNQATFNKAKNFIEPQEIFSTIPPGHWLTINLGKRL